MTPVDLEHLTAELFADMPPKRLEAIEWLTSRADDCETDLAEVVAYRPNVTDPSRLESLETHHTMLEWRRTKLLKRRDELLTLKGRR